MKDDRKSSDRPPRRLKRALLYSGLAAFLLAGATAGYVHYGMNYRIATVLPGRLYRSSAMTPERIARAAARLGIATVIDVRHPELDDGDRRAAGTTRRRIEQERASLAAVGIRHVSIPSLQRPDDAMVETFLAAVADTNAHPVLIHCDHGIGRTGVYVAIFLMEHAGFSNEAARAVVSRYYSARPRGRKHFQPLFNKGEWIIRYVPRRGKRQQRPAAGSSRARNRPAGTGEDIAVVPMLQNREPFRLFPG
jgi:protein tyrosine phosphatase (PTP) superfamily phosphohydrolase (DUF442 family)